MSRVRRSTAAATAGSPSRGIIARRALNVLAWGASGGTAIQSVMDIWGLGTRSRSVPFQADDHPHVVFHRRGGILHRWVQAIVRL